MLYPVIIHKDAGADYGIIVPDFPGVFSGGETLEKAFVNVQEAIETFYEGEENATICPLSRSAAGRIVIYMFSIRRSRFTLSVYNIIGEHLSEIIKETEKLITL